MEQEEVFNLPQTPPLPVASWMLRHSTQLPSSSQLHCWSFFGIKFRGWWNIHLALASPCQVGNGGLIFPGTQKEVVFLSRSQDYSSTFVIQSMLFFSFFFFYFYGYTHSLWKFPGQGLNPSCTCSNAESLIHCARLGMEPIPPQQPELLQLDS